MPVPLDKESEAKVREQAIIYSKEIKHPLSAYQKQINKFAGDIAVRNPSLLTKRGELLEAVRAAVYESGYTYKNGHSRYKRFSHQNPKAPEIEPGDRRMEDS